MQKPSRFEESMAGEKQQQNINFKLARKFIRSLAKELVGDSKRGFFLASHTPDLEDALQKSADSLPAGKLRSTLLPILQHQNRREAFVSALQTEIRALSAKLELHEDVLLTSPASDRLFEALVACVRGKGTSSFSSAKSEDVFSHEDIQCLLSRDPPPHILWALAAMELSFTDDSNGAMDSTADATLAANSPASSLSSSASAFLRRVKPWIVGRNVSVAMATLAPLVPLVFESLKPGNKIVGNIKELRTLIKEVLSFVVALNYKEQFTQCSFGNGAKEALPFAALFEGFQTVYEAFRLDGIAMQMKGPSAAEKLKLMFPLAPEISKKALNPPEAKIGVLADIVKVEFVLLHMVLEVIYCRQKTIAGDKLVKNHSAIQKERLGSIAVGGVAAIQHDLLLDVLLSDLAGSDLLDDGERSFVRFSIFKALLMGGHVFSQKSLEESSASNKKVLEIFFKRIAVARKINASPRATCDILDNLGNYLKAPHKLFDYLKSCKIIKKLSEQGLQNDQALIGWLLHLDDAEFQSVVEGTSSNDSQADKLEFKKEDLCTVKTSSDHLSLRDDCKQVDPDDLFFVDTTGEEKNEVDADTLIKSRKNRKRKERQVLFHRHKHVTKKKEECLSEDSSDSSLDSTIDDQTVVRVKRANQGGDDSTD